MVYNSQNTLTEDDTGAVSENMFEDPARLKMMGRKFWSWNHEHSKQQQVRGLCFGNSSEKQVRGLTVVESTLMHFGRAAGRFKWVGTLLFYFFFFPEEGKRRHQVWKKREERQKSSGVRDRFVHLQYFGLLKLDVLFVRSIIIKC